MMHSQMPVQALFCALLMLPLGVPQDRVELHFSDERVQRAVAFVVREYNIGRQDIPTYFKQLRVVSSESLVKFPNVYFLTLALVQTACLKRPGTTMAYRKVQQCPIFPGSLQVICSFKTTSYHGDTMSLDDKVCIDSDTNTQWSPQIPRF
ncbi:cystatin-like [Crotalus tigris]|uniref:cystatin-like n=1 Tax=Crotalus tigris TaxID=88082 RepID=UPI00192F8BAC|nr:cystatin-like [Crotalus tigris]